MGLRLLPSAFRIKPTVDNLGAGSARIFRLFLTSTCTLLLGEIPLITLPETNIAPENGPSQEESSLPIIHFQVLCSFQGGYILCVYIRMMKVDFFPPTLVDDDR